MRHSKLVVGMFAWEGGGRTIVGMQLVLVENSSDEFCIDGPKCKATRVHAPNERKLTEEIDHEPRFEEIDHEPSYATRSYSPWA